MPLNQALPVESAKIKALLRKLIRGDEPKEVAIKPPFVATSALPGTPEKAAVLAKRRKFGYPLYHKDDARLEDAETIGIEALLHLGNGVASREADGTDDRAASVVGKEAGDEREIRVRLDLAREVSRADAREAKRLKHQKSG
jgi:hypothetical protein